MTDESLADKARSKLERERQRFEENAAQMLAPAFGKAVLEILDAGKEIDRAELCAWFESAITAAPQSMLAAVYRQALLRIGCELQAGHTDESA